MYTKSSVQYVQVGQSWPLRQNLGNNSLISPLNSLTLAPEGPRALLVPQVPTHRHQYRT